MAEASLLLDAAPHMDLTAGAWFMEDVMVTLLPMSLKWHGGASDGSGRKVKSKGQSLTRFSTIRLGLIQISELDGMMLVVTKMGWSAVIVIL